MHAIAVNQLASTPDMGFHRKEFMIMASYVEKWQYNAGWNKETLCCLIQCSTLYKATGNRLCVFIIWSLRTTHACQGMARLVSRVGDLDVVRQQEGEGVQPGCAHASALLLIPQSIWLSPHTIVATKLLFTWWMREKGKFWVLHDVVSRISCTQQLMWTEHICGKGLFHSQQCWHLTMRCLATNWPNPPVLFKPIWWSAEPLTNLL